MTGRPENTDNMGTDYLKRSFRWLHIVWGLVGAAATILLASAKGHPPGLVFVPFALAVWLAGHALLWLSRRLANRGRRMAGADKAGARPAGWPPALIVLAFVGGLVFIAGLLQIAAQLLFRPDRLHQLVTPLMYWVPASLCFFGILLRQNWSRILAGGGSISLAAILIYEMMASLQRGYRNSPAEWATAIVIAVLLLLIGWHILRSPAIKAFFASTP